MLFPLLLLPRLSVRSYVNTFRAGFDSGLDAVQLLFMQSDGGLSPAGSFSGHKAVLSGPAGALSLLLRSSAPAAPAAPADAAVLLGAC
jgi:Hydantoinase/oxoprolinase